eukprot:324937_1
MAAESKQSESISSGWIKVQQIQIKQPQNGNKTFRARTSKQFCKETLIDGKDNRWPVSEVWQMNMNGTQCNPALFVVELAVKFPDGNGWGTGTIIEIKDNNIFVLTCAHNVIDFNVMNDTPIKVNSIKCRMAKSGLWGLDYNGAEVYASHFCAYPRYDSNKLAADDLAIIKFPMGNDKELKEICNYIRFRLLRVRPVNFGRCKCGVKNCDCYDFYAEEKCDVMGYPGEKTDGKLYTASGKVEINAAKGMVAYKLATTNGQSGSPVFAYGKFVAKDKTFKPFYNYKNLIIGVHTDGGMKQNFGCLLTKEKIMWIWNLMGVNYYIDLAKYKYTWSEFK